MIGYYHLTLRLHDFRTIERILQELTMTDKKQKLAQITEAFTKTTTGRLYLKPAQHKTNPIEAMFLKKKHKKLDDNDNPPWDE
jgi:hypothetical protein